MFKIILESNSFLNSKVIRCDGEGEKSVEENQNLTATLQYKKYFIYQVEGWFPHKYLIPLKGVQRNFKIRTSLSH